MNKLSYVYIAGVLGVVAAAGWMVFGGSSSEHSGYRNGTHPHHHGHSHNKNHSDSATEVDYEHDHDHDHHSDHSHDSLGAHVHGLGYLSAAVVGNEFVLSLQAPMGDLIGFEHAPRNEEQRQQASQVMAHLTSAEWLQIPANAACSQIAVVAPNAEDIDSFTGHGDILVELSYTCAQPDNLNHFSVALFTNYPMLERIDVQWLREHEQGAMQISQGQTRVRL